jgi:hypothetical protein
MLRPVRQDLDPSGVGRNEPDTLPSVRTPLPMPVWVPQATYVVVLLLTVLVLLAHSFKLKAVQVDTTTLGLLALLLLAPLAPYITRLKAGGVEADWRARRSPTSGCGFGATGRASGRGSRRRNRQCTNPHRVDSARPTARPRKASDRPRARDHEALREVRQ